LTGFETPDEKTLITPVFRFGGEMKKIRYTIREVSLIFIVSVFVTRFFGRRVV
jgi:hypothetical protein